MKQVATKVYILGHVILIRTAWFEWDMQISSPYYIKEDVSG